MTLGELPEEDFKISCITLEELEDIKTNKMKDQNVKYAARNLTRVLWRKPKQCNIVDYSLIVKNYNCEAVLNRFSIITIKGGKPTPLGVGWIA